MIYAIVKILTYREDSIMSGVKEWFVINQLFLFKGKFSPNKTILALRAGSVNNSEIILFMFVS